MTPAINRIYQIDYLMKLHRNLHYHTCNKTYPLFPLYQNDDLRCNNVRRDRKNRFVAFRVNIKTYDRKLAEKIARNYFYEILARGNGRIYDKNIEWMNVKFKE